MISKYSILIYWNDDHVFIATCQEFLYVSAYGKTYEEAAKEMNIALEAIIDAYNKHGIVLQSVIQHHHVFAQV